MDADQAATVFVEMCTRLDALVDMQRRTNELLGAMESTLREHIEALTARYEASLDVPRPQRGLGSLVPYGDNVRHATVSDAV